MTKLQIVKVFFWSWLLGMTGVVSATLHMGLTGQATSLDYWVFYPSIVLMHSLLAVLFFHTLRGTKNSR